MSARLCFHFLARQVSLASKSRMLFANALDFIVVDKLRNISMQQ